MLKELQLMERAVRSLHFVARFAVAIGLASSSIVLADPVKLEKRSSK